VAVVEHYNAAIAAGQGALWSPTIRCAITAGMPWLDVHCPGCDTSNAVDIRTVDRHPLASVGSLVLGLRCSMCPTRRRSPDHGETFLELLRKPCTCGALNFDDAGLSRVKAVGQSLDLRFQY
jgi:hypothetical protein